MWGIEGYNFSRYACDFNAGHGGSVPQQLKIRYRDGVSLIFQICVEKIDVALKRLILLHTYMQNQCKPWGVTSSDIWRINAMFEG